MEVNGLELGDATLSASDPQPQPRSLSILSNVCERLRSAGRHQRHEQHTRNAMNHRLILNEELSRRQNICLSISWLEPRILRWQQT